MMKLLDSSTDAPPIAILEIKSNDVAAITTVLAAATREAAAATMALGPGAARITPTIITRTEAQDEANRLNLNLQAVIGAKEGASTVITDKVCSNVTKIALCTVNGDDIKRIDDYDLHENFSAAITRTDRPDTNTVLEQLAGVLGYAFNFQQKINANMELLRDCAARKKSYGITVNDTHLTLVLLANTKRAKNEDYGREFSPSHQNIRRTFPYTNQFSLQYLHQQRKNLLSYFDSLCLLSSDLLPLFLFVER